MWYNSKVLKCLNINNSNFLMWYKMCVIEVSCWLTLSREPLESPRPASPVRSSRMSMRPSLLRSSSSNSSAHCFSLSWSWSGDLLSWQHAQGNQVHWSPITGASQSQLIGYRGINSITTAWQGLYKKKASNAIIIGLIQTCDLHLIRPVFPILGLGTPQWVTRWFKRGHWKRTSPIQHCDPKTLSDSQCIISFKKKDSNWCSKFRVIVFSFQTFIFRVKTGVYITHNATCCRQLEILVS